MQPSDPTSTIGSQVEALKSRLEEQLSLEDPGFVGCTRRTMWDDAPAWRTARSNALLALLGELGYAYTPAGGFEFFALHSTWLLQFRGGQWNDYWYDDFFTTWSVVKNYSDLTDTLSRTIIVLQENKGELEIHHVTVPEDLDHEGICERKLFGIQADPPGRIAKNTPRAVRVCRYCPVKQRCDAMDVLKGEQEDWSPSYPRP